MDDKSKTIAAVAIILGVLLVVILGFVAVATHQNVVSPVPDEGAIRIIFVTPTLVPAASPTTAATPTPSPKLKR